MEEFSSLASLTGLTRSRFWKPPAQSFLAQRPHDTSLYPQVSGEALQRTTSGFIHNVCDIYIVADTKPPSQPFRNPRFPEISPLGCLKSLLKESPGPTSALFRKQFMFQPMMKLVFATYMMTALHQILTTKVTSTHTQPFRRGA